MANKKKNKCIKRFDFELRNTLPTSSDVSLFSVANDKKINTLYSFVTPYVSSYDAGSTFRVKINNVDYTFTLSSNTSREDILIGLNALNLGVWMLDSSISTNTYRFYSILTAQEMEINTGIVSTGMWVIVYEGTEQWGTIFGISTDVAFFMTEFGNYTQYKTINGGISFVDISYGGDNDLGVWFFDDLHGLTTGGGGFISTTIDGGANWTNTGQLDGGEDALSIFFINSLIGWACGGAINKSINGGATWTGQDISGTLFLDGFKYNKIQFTSELIGYSSANYDNSGNPTLIVPRVIKSINGGDTWTELTLPVINKLINGIYFISDNIGFAVGGGSTNKLIDNSGGFPPTGLNDNIILKTIDGGANWTILEQNVKKTIYDIMFTDSNNGWTCGEGGEIFYTSDGGDTWTQQTTATTDTIVSLRMFDVNGGWACSNGGKVLKYTNVPMVLAWRSIPIITELFYSIIFSDLINGWACGENGTILRTTNGGANWNTQVSGTIERLRAIFFVDALNGWACGGNGIILRTTNGGTNWNTQVSGTIEDLRSIFFIGLNGWACGENGTILRTTNGGANWNAQVSGTTNGIFSIFFVDTLNGWACGGNGIILRTTNGGTNWNTQVSGITSWLFSIFFVDALNGWACGSNGRISRTTNGGANWNTQDYGATWLFSICFVDVLNGWACGDNGTILRTTDGGANWNTQVSSTTDSLFSIFLADTLNGWACGAIGTILKYSY
jgi:photosystem II stability/assembly factor-like uncharacterized protein